MFLFLEFLHEFTDTSISHTIRVSNEIADLKYKHRLCFTSQGYEDFSNQQEDEEFVNLYKVKRDNADPWIVFSFYENTIVDLTVHPTYQAALQQFNTDLNDSRYKPYNKDEVSILETDVNKHCIYTVYEKKGPGRFHVPDKVLRLVLLQIQLEPGYKLKL